MQNLTYDFEARKQRRTDLSIDPKIARENLEILKRVFDNHSIQFWLVYGTMLGAYRDKQFIPFDTDTDLGSFYGELDKILAARKDMEEEGFEMIRVKHEGQLITFMRQDEYIDIGLFKRKRDLFLKKCWYYGSNRVYGSHFDRFDEIDFLGQSYRIPGDPEALLVQWYGDSWNVPRENQPADLPASFPKVRRAFRVIFLPAIIGFKLIRKLVRLVS